MSERKIKQREAQRKYRVKHRDKILAYLKAYRLSHKEYFNEKKTVNYHENKEKFKAKFRTQYCKRRSGDYWEAHEANLELQEILIGKPLTHKRTKELKYDY